MKITKPLFALKFFVVLVTAVLLPAHNLLSHICWFYTGLPAVNPQPWVTVSGCDLGGGCSTTISGFAAGSTTGQTIGHEHRNWHCGHCIPDQFSASAADKAAYGRAFLAFHRQFILDFDIYRLGHGFDRLEIWDPYQNAPVPGDNEDTIIGFSHCSTAPLPATIERPAGAICTTCATLPASLIGSSLGGFTTLGQVGYELEIQWHASFHSGVADLGCPDLQTFIFPTRDPAFWMAHKKLDEVARDWQRLKAVDLVIVIDRSGSMDDNCSSSTPPATESPCKINDAKTAARLLANIVQDVRMEGGVIATRQHRIGLVSFSDTATPELGLTPANGIVATASTPFNTALTGITAGGGTSIAAGIRQAIAMLASAPGGPNPHQAIVVLTDGMENVSPCLGGSSPSGCAPVGPTGTLTSSEVGDIQIVAIGIEGGPLGGASEANLRDIAERHGGTFLAQADVGAVLTWQKFFVDAFSHIFDSSVSVDPIETLLPGQKESAPFPIEICSDERVSAVIGWEQGRQTFTNCNLQVELFTPSGRLVNRSDPGVEAGEGSQHDFIHVDLPYLGESTGTWHGRVVRRAGAFGDCPAQNYFYSTLVKGLGRVDPFVLRPKVVPGRRILAAFRISESSRPIGGFDSVKATVTLTRANGTIESHPLYDDGSNGDTLAGNNVWSVEIPAPAAEPGVHHLRGHFELTKNGCTRVREAEYSIVVEGEPTNCTSVAAGGVVNAIQWQRPQSGDIIQLDELACVWTRCASSNQYDLRISDTQGWLKTLDPQTGNLVDLPSSFRSGVVSPFSEQCFGRGPREGNPGGGISLLAVIPKTARPGDKSIVSIHVASLNTNQQPVTVTTSIEVFPPPDCNNNGIDDAVDIANGTLKDANRNGVPDECEFAGHFGIEFSGYDFNDCLLPPGTSFPGAGNVGRIADDGTGGNCVVHLTDANQGDAFGVFFIPSTVGGSHMDNIHMHWRSLVGGDNGSVCTTTQFGRPGADGYSMSWGTDLPNPPSYGNPGEEGAGKGLTVTVDTLDNGGGEAPGLEIKWLGARVAFDNINADPGLAKDFLRKGVFVEADLTVDTAGHATFIYDGRVLTASLAGWTGIHGGNFMFGARTGGACDNHWIDDLLIEKFTPGGPVTSCGRNLSVARNGNNIVITWDGGGILQSTASLVPSSWADVPDNPAGSYVTLATGSAQFFRVWCPEVVLSAGGPGVSLLNPTTLLSAVPIINSGTAPAENVQVTAITLTGETLTSPALPAKLGTIPVNGSAVLNSDFSGGPFKPGGSYGLTVEGTYSVGAAIFRFTLAANLVVPPAAPGEAPLDKVTVGANKVVGAPFPPQPRRMGPMVNAPAWTVPIGAFVPGTPTTNGTEALMAPRLVPAMAPEIAAVEGPAPIVFLQNNSLGLTSGANGNVSTTAEPSGGSTGAGVVFASANWVAAFSTDGGNTFTQLDPTTIFPNDAVGFCCDQIVQYVPSIDRFIWLLQGNGYRLASASPADIINSSGTAWTYWNLTPNVFGSCSGFDYPELSVGNNSLYMSWDAGFGGCSGGFQVARTSLAGLQAGGTITIEFTDPANGTMAWGSHLMQNTLDEIFWAGHNNNSQMRVFSLAEGSGTYFWRDINISSWANNAPTSTTPDGQDWLAKNFNGPGGNSFPRNGIIGATRSGNQLWFAWTAGTDRNFQQAHVEMVTLDRGNNFRLIQQVQIWNNSYAFAYPCLATDACSGEVGLSLEYGGNGNYENHVVGFWGDFVVYITTGSNVGTTRYGDYVTLRQHPSTAANPGNLLSAFGYGLNSVPPPGVGTQADIRYVLFGRPASSCKRIP